MSVDAATPPRRGIPGPRLRRHGGPLALGVLLLFNIRDAHFLQLQTLFVNISQVATIAIVAVGMTLVIATSGIDLSVGAVMALAGALAPLTFLSDFGQGPARSWASSPLSLPLVAAAACGVFNGVLISDLGVQPIIATLILFISGRGIALVLTNGNLQTFSNPGFSFLGTGGILGLPFQGWLALGLAILVAWLVGRPLSAAICSRSAATSAPPNWPACRSGRSRSALRHLRRARDRRADRGGDQLGLRCRAQRQSGGARRHRRRRGRRRAAPGGRAPIFGALLGAVIIQLVKYTLLANGVADEDALIAKAAIILGAVYLQQIGRE